MSTGISLLVSAPKARFGGAPPPRARPPRCQPTHFICGSREGRGWREACDAVESARLPRSRAETPWQPTWLPRASDADRRGLCLSCPSPERLSCERQALCECFEYLSPINRVFGSTLLETERSSITTSAERPMRAAILRAPPGAGKASSHAITRTDPCRDLPGPGVEFSIFLLNSISVE